MAYINEPAPTEQIISPQVYSQSIYSNNSTAYPTFSREASPLPPPQPPPSPAYWARTGPPQADTVRLYLDHYFYSTNMDSQARYPVRL